MHKNLLTFADSVPEMGCGGKIIKNHLMRFAEQIRPGNAVLDIAPFLGSTTTFLSCGLSNANNKTSTIYSVDKWELEEKYRAWIKKRGLEIEDLQKEFYKNVSPFMEAGVKIVFYKQDIRSYYYNREPIQLLVDDIGISKDITDHILKTCLPYFIPGQTIIFFMDFYFFEEFKDYESRIYQHDLMAANKGVFKFLERPKNSRTAIFKYLGGEINFIDDKKYYYDFKGAM